MKKTNDLPRILVLERDKYEMTFRDLQECTGICYYCIIRIVIIIIKIIIFCLNT